jgi:glycine/D-amino acid oxidase-like deaminating enzyme
MRKRVLVVGGGVGGMVVALLLARRGLTVTLLEAGPALGSGWRSMSTPAGTADIGIRVPMESGDALTDALVFHGDGAPSWRRLGRLPREGHVMADRLVATTGCLDARFLGGAMLARARAEILARAEQPDRRGAAPNLADRLLGVFGPTLLEAALAPACRSLLGASPHQLAWNAAESRLPSRIVVTDKAETAQLQSIGFLAGRLAHPVAADAPSADDGRSYLYPRSGGIGTWISALEAQLHQAGVAVSTGSRIATLRCDGAFVRAVALSSGEEIACDLLVLAAAPRALPGLPPLEEQSLPVAARLLVVEGGAPPDLDWVVSYDPSTPFIRLGFPDRLEGRRPDATWRVVAELRGPESDARGSLAALGVTAGGTVRGEFPLGTGRFAVETVSARAARDAALGMLARFANLAVLRSATGGHALVHDIVADAARLAAASDAMAARAAA